MEENKNQMVELGQGTTAPGIVVKDLDGTYKTLSDGELKELDHLLESTVANKTAGVTEPKAELAVGFPRFTDLATVPSDEHFEEPKKEVSEAPAQAKKELHFHPEDKDEIQKELDKLQQAFQIVPQKRYSIKKIALKILEKHGVKLKPIQQNMFSGALMSFFRQSRNLVQTRDMLVRPLDSGGMGIASDTADHMLVVARHLKQKIEETDGIVVDEDVSDQEKSEKPEREPVKKQQAPKIVEPRVVAPQMRPTLKGMPEIPQVSQLKTIPTKTPDAKPPVVAEKPPVMSPDLWPEKYAEKTAKKPVPAPARIVDPAADQQQKPVQPPKVEPIRAPEAMPQVSRQEPQMQRPSLQDVTRPHRPRVPGKPMGRIDELASMDLETWRMLDADPRIRAGKILGKIQSLEQESLTRKSQGIAAWRSNEAYQLYLALGQMSLEKKQDVADLIKEINASGKATLTIDEFEAISDLNRMLRF